MNKYILVLVLHAVICASEMSIIDREWKTWKALHDKEYKSLTEEIVRYYVWRDNIEYVKTHNTKHSHLKLAINQFADLTNTEFRSFLNGYQNPHDNIIQQNRLQTKAAVFSLPDHVILPESVDWRTQGYVTPVKDQRMCGSCWAFSATGSLEGQHFKSTGELVSLSEQQLIECSWSYGNNGCQGGLMDNAFRYLIKSTGLDTEKSYPYTALESPFCEFNPSTVGATMSNYVDIPVGNETALQEAVASIGPISVAIDASHRTFQFYKSGVYDEPQCNAHILDHGVLVVGYGVDVGKDYWLVKNSWNTTWGMDGYVQMSRNKNNQCGIATKASYPVV